MSKTYCRHEVDLDSDLVKDLMRAGDKKIVIVAHRISIEENFSSPADELTLIADELHAPGGISAAGEAGRGVGPVADGRQQEDVPKTYPRPPDKALLGTDGQEGRVGRDGDDGRRLTIFARDIIALGEIDARGGAGGRGGTGGNGGRGASYGWDAYHGGIGGSGGTGGNAINLRLHGCSLGVWDVRDRRY